MAREPDSDRLTLDQKIEGSNPYSPATTTTCWGVEDKRPQHLVGGPVFARAARSKSGPRKSGALVLSVKRSFVRLTLPDLCA